MAWKKHQRCPLKLKSYNKAILYKDKTWHIVHEQDGVMFAIVELRKGVTGGLLQPFAPKGLVCSRKDVIFI